MVGIRLLLFVQYSGLRIGGGMGKGLGGEDGVLVGVACVGDCARDWGKCNRGRGVCLGWWNVLYLREGTQCEVAVMGDGQCACDAEWNISLYVMCP